MRAWRNVTLNLALMSIEVGVAPGTHQERVSFPTLHDKCGHQVKQSWYCEACNAHHFNDDNVRGVELEDGNFVRVLDSEYQDAEVVFDAAIRMTKFVSNKEVTHMLIDDSYWLIPKGDQTGYWSLHEAMRKGKVSAIGRSSISKSEHIVCITAAEQGFAMFNLATPAELVQPDWKVLPGDKQAVKMAELFISEFSGTLAPNDFKREDIERKRELVASKLKQKAVKKAKKVVIPPPSDFQAAIRASIELAKKQKAKKVKA